MVRGRVKSAYEFARVYLHNGGKFGVEFTFIAKPLYKEVPDALNISVKVPERKGEEE